MSLTDVCSVKSFWEVYFLHGIIALGTGIVQSVAVGTDMKHASACGNGVAVLDFCGGVKKHDIVGGGGIF